MKVMVMVKASRDSEAGIMPSTELLTAMMNYNRQLVEAGIMLDGAGLTPTSKGARVRFSGESRTVTHGPFAETNELLAGYWVWKVKSLQEAIDWVTKCPNPMMQDSDIEIRPYFENEDFGEALTPELMQEEAALLARAHGLNEPTFQQGKALQIVGLKASYNAETRVAIPQQWARFTSQNQGITGHTGSCYYGVCWNQKEGCEFDYLCGVEVSKAGAVPEGLTALTLPEGRYAVFTHSGHVSAIPKALDLIWDKWAPNSGLKLRQAPFFERYTADYNPNTGMGGIEFWIPLES